MECINPPFSWQLVYYYFRKWSKEGVFEQLFMFCLFLQKDKLDTENLNLDGTHSYVKKRVNQSAISIAKAGKPLMF